METKFVKIIFEPIIGHPSQYKVKTKRFSNIYREGYVFTMGF